MKTLVLTAIAAIAIGAASAQAAAPTHSKPVPARHVARPAPTAPAGAQVAQNSPIVQPMPVAPKASEILFIDEPFFDFGD